MDLQGALIQLGMMALTGAAGWLGGKIKGAAKEREQRSEREAKERDDTRAIVRLLLYYRLKDMFSNYVLDHAEISSADKHEVEEIYRYYHDELGGNGEGSRMYREIMEMQVNG